MVTLPPPRLPLCLLLLLLATAAPALATQDWPEFRGPTAQGHATARNVPVKWDATTNVRWKVPVPGEGWSSPVVVAGRIYLTTALNEADGPSLRALCFAADDGRLVWDREVIRAPAAATKEFHKKNSHASPTPIVRDGVIYVHFGHMGTAALDLAGQVLWRQTGISYPPMHGNGGSPALVGDTLVFSCDGKSEPFLVGLDARTGRERWRTPRHTTAKSKFSFSTPLAIEVDGATQVISPASGFLGAYDPKDGREIWRARYGEGYSVITRPIYAQGLLFVSSSFNKPVLYAVRPQGAQGDVTDTHVAWSYPKAAPNTPSLLAVGDEVYMVSDGGIATCLDLRTGQVHWTERIGGNYSASPIAAEGRIYFQDEAGLGTVLQPGKTFTVLAKNDLGEPTLASPAVIDGALFLRSKSHLWRIGQ